MSRKDLVVLVADADMKAAISAILNRPEAMRIRPVDFDILVHSGHDPACCQRGADFLKGYVSSHEHALLLFDLDGSGREHLGRLAVEASVAKELQSSWQDRAAVIVIEPELEAWVWSSSPHVQAVLGFTSAINLHSELTKNGHQFSNLAKPLKPKEAMEWALRKARKPRSSSLFKQLAEKVSLSQCKDPSFHQFQGVLQRWFNP